MEYFQMTSFGPKRMATGLLFSLKCGIFKGVRFRPGSKILSMYIFLTNIGFFQKIWFSAKSKAIGLPFSPKWAIFQ